jgi:hypothetical protein
MLPQALTVIFKAVDTDFAMDTAGGNISFGPKSAADYEYIYLPYEIPDRLCGTNDLMINRIFRFSPNIFIFSRRHLAQGRTKSPSITIYWRGQSGGICLQRAAATRTAGQPVAPTGECGV